MMPVLDRSTDGVRGSWQGTSSESIAVPNPAVVAIAEARRELGLDPGLEGEAVHRPLQQPRRDQPVVSRSPAMKVWVPAWRCGAWSCTRKSLPRNHKSVRISGDLSAASALSSAAPARPSGPRRAQPAPRRGVPPAPRCAMRPASRCAGPVRDLASDPHRHALSVPHRDAPCDPHRGATPRLIRSGGVDLGVMPLSARDVVAWSLASARPD